MVLWMSAEQMHECSDNMVIQREIEPRIKELEFRLKIDYDAFMKANYNGKKKLVLEVLLRSLDLMEKWKKDIKREEREEIKNIILSEYKELFTPIPFTR